MRLASGRRRWTVLGTAIVCVLGAGAFAYAAIPDAAGTINGCYLKKIGTLRVIDSSSEGCTKLEVPLAWNQTGPQGPDGEQGPPGPSVGVVLLAATGSATAAGQEVIRQVPLTPGSYVLHATIQGTNSNDFPVILGCTAYSSVPGTGIGYQGNAGDAANTLLPDISASGQSPPSLGEVVVQAAFSVPSHTTIRLVCAVTSLYQSITPAITTTTHLIVERVGSVTELN